MPHMPPQHTRDWIDVLEALGPLMAVIAVLIIGFVQAVLQRKQLALVNSKLYRLLAQVATASDSPELLALRQAHAQLVNWMFEAHERQNTVFHGYLELD